VVLDPGRGREEPARTGQLEAARRRTSSISGRLDPRARRPRLGGGRRDAGRAADVGDRAGEVLLDATELKIIEIDRPELDAQLVAEGVAKLRTFAQRAKGMLIVPRGD